MAVGQLEQCDVLVVGAGPVGLLLACELGVRGLDVKVIEAQPAPLAHPKANTHNARSMEIYRRHGLSARLRATGLPYDRPTDVAYFTRLFGEELHRVSLPSPADALVEVREADTRWPTPEPQLRTTQMALEPLLLERARSFPGTEIRFGWQVTGMTEDSDGTDVTIAADDGTERVVRARYVVGCDGGRSWLRRHLDISFMGDEGLKMEFLGGRMQATYFRSLDLLDKFKRRPTWMHWIMHPQGRSILVLIDPEKNEFLMHYQLPPDQPAPDFATKLAAMAGEPIDFEILSGAEWRAGIGVVAERYRDGNAFLAGDAAHLFTPTGGFGLNTGIEDAFNLGWKLALACRGIAGDALLDSYEAERKPIAQRNTRYALKLAANNGACPISPALDKPGPEGDEARASTTRHLQQFARWEFDTPGIQLGGRYDNSPVIAAEAGHLTDASPTRYVPDAAPGGRLPHVWLADDASLFDTLGPEFTLLCLGESADVSGWQAAAAAMGLGLELTTIDDTSEHRALYGADLLLVRPDMYVAWRGDTAADPSPILRRAIGRA